MANISYGVNILPKTNNAYTLGNSDYKWSNIYTTQLNGTNITSFLTSHQDISELATKASPIFIGSFSHNRKASTTIGTNSVTIGDNCEASAEDSYAEGRYTVASGYYSHAEGNYTTASGMASHAEGTVTIANHASQHVFGEYNVADASSENSYSRGNYIEIVGNGTASNATSNARTLDWSGNERLKGTLYIGCNADNSGGTEVAAKTNATTSIAGLMSATDKTKLDGIATGANKPVILTYNTSTWNDFITAYTSGATIYCYVEADDNEYRIAQLTYVNDMTNPTFAQFQYYRARGSKITSSSCDQLFQYSLNSTEGWSTGIKYTGPKTITATNGISVSFSNNDMTISGVEATTSTAGMMSAADKLKLNNMTTNGEASFDNATTSTAGLMSAADKTKLDGIATGATADTVMIGATSSAAGTSGLVPAPATTDVDKFLAGDGTYKSGGLPMVILSYGTSTWNDFITAYNNNVIVYCRASSNDNPASGSQTRLGFMAYVNDATSPTEVEFQYYRSIGSHTTKIMGDEVYVYKLTSSGTWTVTKRYASIREISAGANGNLSVSWSSNKVTIDGGLPAVTSNDNGKILKVVDGAWALVTP